MKISYSKPPIWDECVKAFGEENIKDAVFPYGDMLYNPSKGPVPDHLEVHEAVHMDQQQHDESVAAIWWKRYIADVPFRIEQEVEACQAQYKFICTKVKDKNARFRNLHILAQLLASPMYGNVISYMDALRKIRG